MKQFIDLIKSLSVPTDTLHTLGMELWDTLDFDQPECCRLALGIREPKQIKQEMQKNIAMAENILRAIADKLEEL